MFHVSFTLFRKKSSDDLRMEETYQPRIEPKPKAFLIVLERDDIHRRGYTVSSPGMTNFLVEEHVTGGLGFKKIPHMRGLPREYDAREDLVRHLAEMDMMVEGRNQDLISYVLPRIFSTLVRAEDDIYALFDEAVKRINDFGKCAKSWKEYATALEEAYMNSANGMTETLERLKQEARERH